MIASLLRRRWPRAGAGRRLRTPALLAAVAGAGLATVLSTGAVSAQAAPPPAPGTAPATATVSPVAPGGGTPVLVYTATDGSVWMKNLSTGAYTPAHGDVVGAPAAIAAGAGVIIFARGTDNQLWWNFCNLFNLCGAWSSLGGNITGKPGAVQTPNIADYSVYARGTDGAVWGRDRTSSGWGPWHSLGGNVLAGTGPSAAYLNGTYVLVTGTNHETYIQKVGATGFSPAGGQTNGSPALTALPSAQGQPAALVGFATGTNNIAYYHRFLSSSPGWHSFGGRFTSGLGAATQVIATVPDSNVVGLGTDNQVYENIGAWGSYPPSFGGWTRIS